MNSKFERDMICISSSNKTKVERYLQHTHKPMEKTFNILQWWKNSQNKYPTLAFNTSKCTFNSSFYCCFRVFFFSMEGRILDSFHTSLSPRMVEVFICAQNWLLIFQVPLFIENLLELEGMKENWFVSFINYLLLFCVYFHINSLKFIFIFLKL